MKSVRQLNNNDIHIVFICIYINYMYVSVQKYTYNLIILII